MKLKQLLTNKKIVIVALVVLIALIVGIAILVTPNSKETDSKDANVKTEQSKGDAVTNGDEDKTDESEEANNSDTNNSAGLEVLKPDEIAPENSSNASGNWDGTTNSNQQTDKTDETDETGKGNPNNNSNEDEEDNGEEQKKDEDILEDDINWGRIY